MTKVTFACVFVEGNVPYTAQYVLRLYSMLNKNTKGPASFVCLTDRPRLLPASYHTIRIGKPNGVPGWWSKLELFNPRNALRGRVVYVDLDVLVVKSVDPVVEFNAPVAFIPHSGDWQGRNGLAVVKRYNSSVMKFDNIEKHQHLYTKFEPGVTRKLWGDQDWIGQQMPDEAMMPIEWFPRLSELRKGPTEEARIVLCKRPKNEVAAQQMGWVREAWQ